MGNEHLKCEERCTVKDTEFLLLRLHVTNRGFQLNVDDMLKKQPMIYTFIQTVTMKDEALDVCAKNKFPIVNDDVSILTGLRLFNTHCGFLWPVLLAQNSKLNLFVSIRKPRGTNMTVLNDMILERIRNNKECRKWLFEAVFVPFVELIGEVDGVKWSDVVKDMKMDAIETIMASIIKSREETANSSSTMKKYKAKFLGNRIETVIIMNTSEQTMVEHTGPVFRPGKKGL